MTRRADVVRRAAILEAAVASDPAYAHTRNLVVSHAGETVLERHFGAGAVNEPVDTYSMTKSVVATLAGIALERGLVASLDEPVAAFLGKRVRHAYTLRHLLTMTAGTEIGGAWEIDEVLARPAAWVDWILTAPRRHEPGDVFAYDNGAAHVLGAALSAAVGEPLSAFAADHLFRPVDIDAFAWPRDPDGVDYGFGHVRLSPIDLAKLGELYLGRGAFRGRRVVSEAFVGEATTAHSPGGGPELAAYGYLWWVGNGPVPHFFAAGYAGQSLTVIPQLQLVVVTTGDEALLRPGWRNARHAAREAFAE